MPRRSLTKVTESSMGMRTPAFVGTLFFLGVFVVGGAIMIGRSDSGQINVAATIQSNNQAVIDAGGTVEETVGTLPESLRNLPNGGLVPTDNVPEPILNPTPETGSTTATTPDTEGDSNVSTETATEPQAESVTEEGAPVTEEIQ